LLYNSPLGVSSPQSSLLDIQSATIERTEVLTNPDDMIKISLRIFEQLSESMDAICDNKGVQVTINTKPIWDGMHVLKSKGVKLRWITDITEENPSLKPRFSHIFYGV
jgi:hypothetical protein